MNIQDLRLMQNLPLDIKVAKTKLRINDAFDEFGADGLYVSLSGGKDSTVLHHLVMEVELERFGKVVVPRVFCDTGLEYPELKEFVRAIADVIIRPKMNFKQVINTYGYPIITKSQSFAIYKLRHNNLTDAYRNKLLHGDEKGTAGKLSNKWHYLLDAPFEISNKCCDVMKKRPFAVYEKETGRIPFEGTMADESTNRQTRYLKDGGCNAFNNKKPKSKPLGFWCEQDILEYIYVNNIEISKPYGEVIINDKGLFETTGESRTGCLFCGFGCHLEKGTNRFQRLKKTHPHLYDYCIEDLGMGYVLDYINVDYR